MSVSALIMTTGMSLVSGLLLIIRNTSSPFKSGIIISSKTRLNFCFSIRAHRLVSARRARNPFMSVGFEQHLQGVSIVLIVVDDEDGW